MRIVDGRISCRAEAPSTGSETLPSLRTMIRSQLSYLLIYLSIRQWDVNPGVETPSDYCS
jgi:hypothetical protein